ncbi:MAG TPA: choice-of-anchor D domain-containing protein [Bacteroidota bacterium]|nr:choice-of-anchor D domain-containing protein [Bacteroidota bacterium]
MISFRQLVVVACLSLVAEIAYSQSIVQVIPLPNSTYWNQVWGAFADSTHLYMSSGTTTAVFSRGHVYKLDFNGNVVDSVVTGLNSSQGLAWDGSHFWYIRGSGSTGRIYRVSTAGALVDSIIPPSTTWFLGGACWDGTGLWVSLYSPNAQAGLYKYDVVTKTIIDTIPSIGQQPQGTAWDGQYLYYAMDLNSTEPNLNLIYVVDPVTGDTVRTIPMPESPTIDSNPRGLAWDGNYLWLVAEPVGASSGRSLYKYDLSGSGTPDINLGVSLVDFGGVRIGEPRNADVGLQNAGTAALVIDSVIVALSGTVVASIATPLTIVAGGSDLLPLAFTPTAFGRDSASVRIYSNDPDEGVKVLPVRGYGIYGSPTLSTSSSYDFGARRVGSSNSWRISIQNQGGPQLSISAMTVSDSAFRLDAVTFPVSIDSLASKSFRVWFSPASATAYIDTLKITSNASNGPVTNVVLRGSGDASVVLLGQPFWTFTVPNNPRTSSNQKLMKAVRSISDITSDGTPDVVVSSENYWTMALNGNASVSNDTLWAFNTYIANTSAGSIGSTGDYSHQKALAVADLNQDGYKDVIIGTGGGNEHVYALNGFNGQILWQFGTDNPDSFGLGDITGVDASMDFSGDGVSEVFAAGSATDAGGVGGRRSVYLFDGTNGNIRWISPLHGFTHAVTAVGDISGDGVPDVVGCVGEPSYKASAFNGTNGALLWDFVVPSASGGGKEVLAWPVSGQTPDLIVSAFWGPVHRVDGESGTQMWSRPTGGSGVMQLIRLRDVTGDGVDEIVAPLLLRGVYCINGANGNIVWSLPTGNTMGAAAISDLNNDDVDDVVLAVQNQGTMIVRGQDGVQLALYPTGTQQAREVAVVPDIDGNSSLEIIMGGQQGNVALISGGDLLTSVGEGAKEIPQMFEMEQNYPNPFNPTTTIQISMPSQADLTLAVFDVLGRQVKSFAYERVPAGVHSIVWDGTNAVGMPVASGAYFYQARSGDRVLSKRMIMLR